MFNLRILTLAIASSILFSACSNDDGGGPPASGTGVSALFSADPLDPNNPFPTDRLLDGSGHVRVPSAIIEKVLPDEPRSPVRAPTCAPRRTSCKA